MSTQCVDNRDVTPPRSHPPPPQPDRTHQPSTHQKKLSAEVYLSLLVLFVLGDRILNHIIPPIGAIGHR
ncbi:hypothetical protein [Halomicronema hongdechloris]|uniref:hypothetical protein n=1 Tax=Halomicronema hongdechloris TaxID=1209493 RepID=UPI0010CBCE23|nr:hypothetical protein [Halomicronema hongdechloris]